MSEGCATKYCSSCRVTKPISEFHKRTVASDGLQTYCKLCLNAKNNARNKLMHEDRAANVARWIERHPLEHRIAVTKVNHRNRLGMPKDPTVDAKIEELIRTSPPCTYCGAKTDLAIDHKVARAVGGVHTVDQLQPICKSCNSRKRMQSDTEFRHQLAMETHGYKRCSKCRMFKLRGEFSTRALSFDGLCGQCKSCRSATQVVDYHK